MDDPDAHAATSGTPRQREKLHFNTLAHAYIKRSDTRGKEVKKAL